MHGCGPGFASLVNAEYNSMGGVYDGGVSIDTKSSPRQAAIEKAQAELRLEYDVREERRRELEFLERGGNPLDFRFGPLTSTSVQSTSLADHLLENEGKGSFAVATSTQGDSAESSGRPGAHFTREPNIADNLLLLDGAHKSFHDEKIVGRSRKRKASTEQTAKQELSHTTKESEESSMLHLSVNGQAYARRNRTNQNRDNAHASATDLSASKNRISQIPSSQLNSGHHHIKLVDTRPDDQDSSACKLIRNTSYDGTKTRASEDHQPLDDDGVVALHPHELHADTVEASESRSRVPNDDNLQASKDKDPFSQAGAELSRSATISTPPGRLVKGKLVAENVEDGQDAIGRGAAANGFKSSRKRLGSQNETLANARSNIHPGSDTSTHDSLGSEPSQVGANSTIDTTSLQSLLKKPSSNLNGVIKEENHPCGSGIVPDIIKSKENGDTTAAAVNLDEHAESNSVPLHISNMNAPQSPSKDGDLFVDGTDKLGTKSNEDDTDKIDSGLMSQPGKRLDITSSCTSDILDKASNHQTVHAENLNSSAHACSGAFLPKKSSVAAPELQADTGDNSKMAQRSHEDAILKEARIIEAKRRRAKEPLSSNYLFEKLRKSHWDYVLEEMTWLANDFIQERLWKITAAAQICRKISSSGQSMLEVKNLCQMQRKVARVLAESVTGFWQFAEKNKGLSEEDLLQNVKIPIQRYAVRLLQFYSSHSFLAGAPRTPDRVADCGTIDMSSEEQISDESMFYKVPLGSMQAYRESVEAYWRQYEELDCEASVGDSMTEFKNQGNLPEDDDETGMYYLPKAFEANRLLNFSPKKTKGFQKNSGAYRSHGSAIDSPYDKLANQSLLGKRPSTLNVVPIPTKRVRTATRQRAAPLSTNATGVQQVTSKTDVSSGDTNSFQDEESSLQGFSQKKNAEIESTVDYVKQLPFDGVEVPVKPKKKKPKYVADCGGFASSGKCSSHDRKWSMDSISHLGQTDPSKRRLDGHHFEAVAPGGIYAQLAQKKPKVLKQFPDPSPESVTPATRPSPVASQMSNMSNSNKLIKVIQNRDRGKKNKGHKGATGQSGSGIAWSQFEDQALVVLVHDMGPNWELVCDAINSTLQFKCIFRKPKECKERHKVLMDRNASDGADSAEDSGSSQHYDSTLPGIPKGSARQLFQRLQGPLEEDTIKAHFEKIIMIGQKLHVRRIQDNQELKQTIPVHNSHFQALSQACPNNLSGGEPLTPLDLCDAITPSQDAVGFGYQGHQNNGIGLPSQPGSVTPNLPASGANSTLQGSPGMVMGNSFPSPAGAPTAPIRDAARYGMSRSASLSVDDQQRVQYHPTLPNKAVSGAFSVGSNRGVRMLSGGNNVGMMCGMNLGMPAPRPGFQGIGSPGVLNISPSGSMLSSNGVGMPNMHHGAISTPASSMGRHEPLQPRPSQILEEPRQLIMQEFQVQAAQGNGQTMAPFSPMSAPFSNQNLASPLVQTIPVQQQQPPHQNSQGQQQAHIHRNPHPHIHGSNFGSPQQQAYAMRLAKERILHQQQPFSGSGTASPLQSSSQLQQSTQASSPLPPISPSHSQNKQQTTGQNSQTQAGGTVSSQMVKQRQRPQLQQQQARQQTPQQQAKIMKSVNRGGALMHQNVPADGSYINGPSAVPGNQILEKHMLHQRQAFYPSSSPVSGIDSTFPQTNNQRMHPRSSKASTSSQTDNNNQGPSQVPPDQSVAVSLPQPVSSSLPSSSQHQQQRLPNQSHQTMKRVMLQQKRQLNPDGMVHSGTDSAQPNQNRSVMAMPHSMDSTNSIPDVMPGSISPPCWKPDRSVDASTAVASNVQIANSSQPNLVGGMEPLIPSSNPGLMQRQFSGSFPVHGHGSGPWQQHQQLQSQQPRPSTSLTHQQQRQPGQGTLYGRPSPNP